MAGLCLCSQTMKCVMLWNMYCSLGLGVEALKWEAGGLWAIFMLQDVICRSWLWDHMRFTSSLCSVASSWYGICPVGIVKWCKSQGLSPSPENILLFTDIFSPHLYMHSCIWYIWSDVFVESVQATKNWHVSEGYVNCYWSFRLLTIVILSYCSLLYSAG